MIEILQAELTTDQDVQYWLCWLRITQGAESWPLPATAPDNLTRDELQAHFDAKEAELWTLAQRKKYPSTLIDFKELDAKITAELDYLNTTIPAIDTMTATQVRAVVKRLALENQAMLRAWRYVVRRL